MNLTKIAALLALTALAGLGGACSQPPVQSGPQTQADAASPSRTEGTTAIPAAASAGGASLAGTYEGELEGASAQVTISGSAPRYNVHIIIGGDGCAGGALGPAQVGGAGVLTMR